jgi:hypothetical protein
MPEKLEWRIIPDFPLYEVSNKGNVRTRIGKDLMRSRANPLELSPGPYVTLYSNGQPYSRYVRTLVRQVWHEQ